jgi:protein-L-isoaspartate(D-aspartate) O-methyltransferase
MKESDFEYLRQQMVINQIFKRQIDDPEILEAFRQVKRQLFVPEEQRKAAYDDCPLPIGQNQTISQPYIVALMTKILDISPGMSVLEVGTGSGYQAAILSVLGAKVYGVERIPSLAKKAKELLDSLGYKIEIRTGDGTLGWPEYAPYDRIIVAAASPKIPQTLIEQLKIAGKLVIPLEGRFHQDLTLVDKVSKSNIKTKVISGCVFVPLIGKHGHKE